MFRPLQWLITLKLSCLPPPSSACSLPAGNNSLPSASDGGHEKLTQHPERRKHQRREGHRSQMTSRPRSSRHQLGNLDPERALKGPMVTQLTTQQVPRVLNGCQPEGLKQIRLPLRKLECRGWAFLGCQVLGGSKARNPFSVSALKRARHAGTCPWKVGCRPGRSLTHLPSLFLFLTLLWSGDCYPHFTGGNWHSERLRNLLKDNQPK